MRGFRRFAQTVITITGIALVHHIHNSQFDGTARCSSATRTPQIWDAVLAAFALGLAPEPARITGTGHDRMDKKTLDARSVMRPC